MIITEKGGKGKGQGCICDHDKMRVERENCVCVLADNNLNIRDMTGVIEFKRWVTLKHIRGDIWKG